MIDAVIKTGKPAYLINQFNFPFDLYRVIENTQEKYHKNKYAEYVCSVHMYRNDVCILRIDFDDINDPNKVHYHYTRPNKFFNFPVSIGKTHHYDRFAKRQFKKYNKDRKK